MLITSPQTTHTATKRSCPKKVPEIFRQKSLHKISSICAGIIIPLYDVINRLRVQPGLKSRAVIQVRAGNQRNTILTAFTGVGSGLDQGLSEA